MTFWQGASSLSIHSWLLRTPHHTILVDTCTGNDKNRPMFSRFHMRQTGYLERLQAAGVSPDGVDFVLLRHSSPRRPLRLEHPSCGWALGSDLPKRQICLRKS